MKSSDIEIGYELEFGSNLTTNNLKKGIQTIFKNGDDRTRGNWRVGTDGSIRTNFSEEIEIASPVFSLKEGMRNLGIMFEYMSMIDADVNDSCGLHINIGFKDKKFTKTLDPLKVVMLTDEDKWLRSFRRLRNSHCNSVRKTIASLYKNGVEPDFDKSLAMFKRSHRTKYDAVNTTKLSYGYVEFRIMGNKHYHRRFADVADGIAHFTEAMLDTANNRRNDVYETEIDKLAKSVESVKPLIERRKEVMESRRPAYRRLFLHGY